MAHFRPFSQVPFPAAFLLLAGAFSSLAQDPAGAARLESFSGQISVLHDSTPWALHVGDVVQPQQVIVTGPEGYGIFKVSDGSTFEVFPKSQVVFRANRGDWKDLLEVWLGKIRVQIEHFGGLPNNNRVRTPSAVISVRGTVFDVEVDEDTDTTLVLDEEGQVEVRHLLKPGTPRLLGPGEWVRVYKNDQLAKSTIDKGSLLQRAAKAASDAFYQAALNASRGASTVARGGTATGTTPTAPADTTKGNPAPPTGAPPPPPSGAPPGAPPQ